VSAALPVTVVAAPAALPDELLAFRELPDEPLALGVAADALAWPPAPLIAAGGVVTALVLCVLNDSSTTRPATVPTIARMTRRMSGAFHQSQDLVREPGRKLGSEFEGLVVNALAVHAGRL